MSQIMDMDMTTISQVKTTNGKSKCIPWEFLKKFLAKCEDEEQVFKVFAIVVYRMVIFPKVPNHIETAVVDLVEQVEHKANPISAIVVETICSLNFCRRKVEGQFIGCVQLLYMWIKSHFWGMYSKSLKHFMDTFMPLEEFVKTTWLMYQLREQWVYALRTLDSKKVTWKAP